MDERSLELRDKLSPADWNKYSDALPLFSRPGEGYPEIYLGRDIAGSPVPIWRLYLLSGVGGSLIMFHPLITEQMNWFAGLGLSVAVALEAATGGKTFNKVFSLLDVKKRTINPEI